MKGSERFPNAIFDIRFGFQLGSNWDLGVPGMFWQFVRTLGASENYFGHVQINLLEFWNATTAPFWKRSSCILGRSGLFGKGYESVLDKLGAVEVSNSVSSSISGVGTLFFPFLAAIREAFGKRTERKLAIRKAFDLFGEVSESVRRVFEKNTM